MKTPPSRLTELPKSIKTRLLIRTLQQRYPFISDLALIMTWIGLWRISAAMEYLPHATIWFPPSALTFVSFLMIGKRVFPAILISGLIATFWENTLYASNRPLQELLSTGLLFGIGHSLAYGIGAHLLSQRITKATPSDLPRILLLYLLIGSCAALIASIFGLSVLVFNGVMAPADMAKSLVTWWFGDLIGILVLTPVLSWIVIIYYPKSHLTMSHIGLIQLNSPARNPFIIKLLVGILLTTLIMFAAAQFRFQEMVFSVFFLCIPQMWIVYTETPLRSGISLALMSTWTALLIKLFELGDHIVVYQFSVCILAASTYFGMTIPLLASTNLRLREMAFYDGLTKTASREHFWAQAETEIRRARFYGQPATLIVFDIDKFKQINDHYGHTIGDGALLTTAQCIGKLLHQADLLGRFGGDEFMILLPGADLELAKSRAEALRQTLSKTQVPTTDHWLSGSFGVVMVEPEETIQEAFKRADTCLLQAKQAGRNCVIAG
ncbi:hypothetical protein BFW38_05385 [Terasakiispira papahanaumokuakeensis]|uniref:diguanylate cyclase n=1 Tax=Terasakiispira papahanaumokuakeensis TaxID=197479 RepID=A0A1E2V8S9_9GAMM|nr:diguanylate cyclase [Terasakiispira papahanaumokuakeensis]ODC03065.1 hypothetical protein BFW38_05385 [Terasakiispira papahanaumokuakeensis]